MKHILYSFKQLSMIVISVFICMLFLINIGMSNVNNYLYLSHILSDKNYVSFNLTQMKLKQGTKSLLELPDENYNHSDGIYAMTNNTASLPYGDLPQSYSYGTSKFKVLNFAAHFFTKNECEEIASGFLQRQFPNFFTKGQLILTVNNPEDSQTSLRGTWKFNWKILDHEGLVAYEASVYVRSIDGKVVSYTVRHANYPAHQFPAGKAKEKVLSVVRANTNLTNIKVTGVLIFPTAQMFRYKNLPKTVFRINLQGTDLKSNNIYTTSVTVDADTGNILKINPLTGDPRDIIFQWERLRYNQNEKQQSNDFMPTWTSSGLLFISTRHLQNSPSWIDTGAQILLKTPNGEIRHLTSDLIDTPGNITGLPNSPWIGLQRSAWSYAINLKSSDYRVLGNPLRPAEALAVRNDGSEAIISGFSHSKRPGDDMDLMADDLDRSAPLALRNRIQQTGIDTLPIFSLDGKSLYYVSIQKEKKDISFVLKRMDVTSMKAANKNPKSETIIKKLPAEPVRLTFFPNGKKLLMQAKGRIYTIDLKNRKTSEVRLEKLHAQKLGALIKDIRDNCAGPTDTQITFAGKTLSSNGDIRWRIYSCGLNGENLHLMTPFSSNEIESYTFPFKKVTAFEFSKKLALHEVEWVEGHKRD